MLLCCCWWSCHCGCLTPAALYGLLCTWPFRHLFVWFAGLFYLFSIQFRANCFHWKEKKKEKTDVCIGFSAFDNIHFMSTIRSVDREGEVIILFYFSDRFPRRRMPEVIDMSTASLYSTVSRSRNYTIYAFCEHIFQLDFIFEFLI